LIIGCEPPIQHMCTCSGVSVALRRHIVSVIKGFKNLYSKQDPASKTNLQRVIDGRIMKADLSKILPVNCKFYLNLI